jgi:hypothetical protein
MDSIPLFDCFFTVFSFLGEKLQDFGIFFFSHLLKIRRASGTVMDTGRHLIRERGITRRMFSVYGRISRFKPEKCLTFCL